MRSNLVDSTTLHAVESVFREGQRDPWALTLAGQLADFYVYSDLIRYPVPALGSVPPYDLTATDSLLADLARRDSTVFQGHVYSTAKPRMIADGLLEPSFREFGDWAIANPFTLKAWLAFHHEPWIRQHREATVGLGFMFDLQALARDDQLTLLAQRLQVSEEDICYAYDSVMKYPLFGELVGEGAYYLNHPIRDVFPLPTMSLEHGAPPPIAITFASDLTSLAQKLTRDEYGALLHELRGTVREFKVDRMRPGDVDKGILREIGATLSLPPRLARVGSKVGIFGGAALTVLGALNSLTMPVAILGAAISIATYFWKGTLPRNTARLTWLRWAMKWDIEDQARQRH